MRHANMALAHVPIAMTSASQSIKITTAPMRPARVLTVAFAAARARHSIITAAGTNLRTRMIATGNKTISSRNPSTGMKSGMRVAWAADSIPTAPTARCWACSRERDALRTSGLKTFSRREAEPSPSFIRSSIQLVPCVRSANFPGMREPSRWNSAYSASEPTVGNPYSWNAVTSLRIAR